MVRIQKDKRYKKIRYSFILHRTIGEIKEQFHTFYP